jgi:addiction module RelB/DinJ family antitoxin
MKHMQTMLSIKIDKKLKEEAQEVAHILGVSLNAVINQNIKEFVSERQVTFADHPLLNKKTEKLLARLSKDAREGKNMAGPFSSMDEMIKSLNS